MRNFLWFYFSLKGRISRLAYWAYFILPPVIAGAMAAIIVYYFKISPTPETKSLIETVVTLLFLWPSIAVQAKRWHDLNKSGWWVLINLIPIVGILVFLGIGFFRGTRGNNRFGSDPVA